MSGAFPDDFSAIPQEVLQILSKQLGVNDLTCVLLYSETLQRHRRAVEIQDRYGHRVLSDVSVGFRLTRWLYALCWTGTDRPGELFNRSLEHLTCNSPWQSAAQVYCWMIRQSAALLRYS
nr:DUF4158 domain-containing protein [Pseudomonas sp. R4-35-07]